MKKVEARNKKEVTMKHIHKITVKKAEDEMTPDDLSGLLDQVFGFVLNLVADKGKGGQNGGT